jgi:hypothetical protein
LILCILQQLYVPRCRQWHHRVVMLELTPGKTRPQHARHMPDRGMGLICTTPAAPGGCWGLDQGGGGRNKIKTTLL